MGRVAYFALRLLQKYHNCRSHEIAQRKRDQQEAKFAREKIAVDEQRPESLPLARHNLSQTSLALHPQSTCLLLMKLPLEIRQYIYKFVLGGRVTHLVHGRKRILMQQRSEVVEEIDHTRQGGSIAIQRTPYVDWIEGSDELKPLDQCSKQLLSLLKTCHVIYAEGIPIFYSSNVFTIASPLVLIYLHDHILLPQRFSQIRHLNLLWTYRRYCAELYERKYAPYDNESWIRLWDLIAGMDLRTLGIDIAYNGGGECSTETDWVQPLMKVKGVERVGLALTYMFPYLRLNDLEEQIEKQWTSG